MMLNPWEFKEVKDYNKLMKEFGINDFSEYKKRLKNTPLEIRRGLVIGHKDFHKIYESIAKKKKFAVLTGLMPSGVFHLGHMTVINQVIYYQKLGAKIYLLVADLEAQLTRNIKEDEARKIAIEEYLINYIALGLKNKNLNFYFQTKGPKKVQEYMNLSKLASAKTTITPVGFDQHPHASFTRDIASRMGFSLPAFTFHKLLPGLQGIKTKMSSSKPESYIALTDDEKTVETKIKKYAFSGGRDTLEEHRKKGGNPDIDISYQYLTFFEEDDKKLEKIYQDYKSGKLLSGELKQITIEKINKMLKEHQKKRDKARKQIDKFLKW